MFFSFLQNRSQEQQHYFNTPFRLIRSLIGVDFVFLPQFIQTKIKTVKHFFCIMKHVFSFLQNRSQEQQHYFNTPFQLSLPPSHLATEVLSDAPESADRYEFSVEHGDVILLATDGIFDNIPDSVLVKEVGSLQRGRQAPDPAEIQVKQTQFKKSASKILVQPHQN